MHATPVWRARYVGERLAQQLLGAVTGLAHPCIEPGEFNVDGVTLAVCSRPRVDVFGVETGDSELSWRLAALTDSREYRWVEAPPLSPGAPQRLYTLRSVRYDVEIRIVDVRERGKEGSGALASAARRCA
jgi:hypothetical protein